MRVVCNTSPLILLAKTGRVELLQELYESVHAPEAVLEEIQRKSGPEVRMVRRLVESGRLRVEVVSPGDLAGLPGDLGPGELEAVALSRRLSADLVLLDDQAGRTLARALGLRVSGTIGVLVEAKLRGLIQALRPELDRLAESGLWMSEALYDRVLQSVEE